MSFTFAELKTAIQDYSENTETTFVNNLSIFIENAEQRIFESVQLEFFRKNVTANLTSGNQQSYVGWDGMTYIDPVQQHNRLSVIPADGGPPCQAEFSLAKPQGIQRVGPVVCR